MTIHIMTRADSAANWTTEDPVLYLGEMGLEMDTRKYKVGDAQTPWSGLPYWGGGGGGDLIHILPPVTTSFIAEAGNFYYVDTIAASTDITITFPLSPTAGDRLAYAKSNYDINNEVILNGNGNTINDSSNLTPESIYGADWKGMSFIFDTSNNNWIPYNSVLWLSAA